jgi:hypothetical protein
MEPTNNETKVDSEVPEEFAAAWANVLLDLNEKQTQPMQSEVTDPNSNTEEQQCESTSKPTPN